MGHGSVLRGRCCSSCSGRLRGATARNPDLSQIPQSPFQSSLSCRPFSYQRYGTIRPKRGCYQLNDLERAKAFSRINIQRRVEGTAHGRPSLYLRPRAAVRVPTAQGARSMDSSAGLTSLSQAQKKPAEVSRRAGHRNSKRQVWPDTLRSGLLSLKGGVEQPLFNLPESFERLPLKVHRARLNRFRGNN